MAPNKGILDRESHEQYESLILPICSTIEEVIDYAANAAEECIKRIPNTIEPQDDHIVILSVFFHIIEMLDGIEILISKSAVTPTHLQIRCVFEALLYLEWILQKDTKKRAHAYLVEDIHDRLALAKCMDANSERGKQLKAICNNDKYGVSFPFSNLANSSPQIDKYNNLLLKPHFKEANELFTNNTKTKPKWYGLHGGGNSIKELADKMGRPYQYWLLYTNWSATMHGQKRVRNKLDKDGAFKSLRDPSEIKEISIFAIHYGIEAIILMNNFYKLPSESYSMWYQNKISNKMKWLTSLEIKINYVASNK